MKAEIVEVEPHTPAYDEVLILAGQFNQAKYILARETHIITSILVGAFTQNTCAGFLRFLIQVIGSDHGRTPITRNDRVLMEGYVEAFGVAPTFRRQGIGQQMQERAIAICRQQGCYQIRSRSPITSQENYALKLKMGYAIHPSAENDSYYFIKTLGDSTR